jgi:hypothetical protein
VSNNQTSLDIVRSLAEANGLGRALETFPDGVTAGVERGLRPVGDPPGGHDPNAHPAPVFDPARYEPRK